MDFNESNKEGKFPGAWLVLAWLMGAGLLVRVWGLGKFTLSPDEVLILMISGHKTLAGVWAGLSTQAHPPLHFVLMHYLLLISRDIYFLKATSIVPGIALIIAFFYLGRSLGSEYHGIVLAYFAAFGYGAVQMSEVVRPYSLLVLALTIALLFYLRYQQSGRTAHAAGYSALMVLALSLHYSAAIVIGAVGGAWFVKTAVRGRRKDWTILVLTHLPLAVLGIALYYFHLSRISESRREWMSGYLRLAFSHTPSEMLDHLRMLFSYSFHPRASLVMAVFFAVGCWALWKKRRDALAIIAAVLIAAMTLMLAGAYPLLGSRHNSYLFPFLAMAAGAGVVEVATAAARPLARLARRGDLTGSRVYSLIPALLIILSTLLVIANCSKFDFLRAYQQAQISEFTLTRQTYDDLFMHLEHSAGPHDVIFCSGQAGGYIEFFSRDDAEPLSADLARDKYEGLTFYFNRDLSIISDRDELRRDLIELEKFAALRPGGTLWIMDIGYYNSKFKQAVDGLFRPVIAKPTMMEKESVVVYAIPAEAAVKALE